jgi:hypothetical protein
MSVRPLSSGSFQIVALIVEADQTQSSCGHVIRSRHTNGEWTHMEIRRRSTLLVRPRLDRPEGLHHEIGRNVADFRGPQATESIPMAGIEAVVGAIES